MITNTSLITAGISSNDVYVHALDIYFNCLCRGLSSDEATLSVIEEQIPALSDLSGKGQLHVDNIDVFCERGVFDIDQSRRILSAGKREGWRINFHGDELHPMGAGEVMT